MMPIKTVAGLLGLLSLVAACAVGPSARPPASFNPKSQTPPPIKHCFDGLGHQTGAKPFVLGGSCVCTPNAEVLADYQRHGYFVGYNLDDLLRYYRERGIQTAHDHKGCNNLCTWGPHLVKGGQCMVPPTPGTRNYEEVLSGRFPPPAAKKPPTP